MKCDECRNMMDIENRLSQGGFVYFWYCCPKCHRSFLMKVPAS